jgi:hypothetical protein
MSPRAQRLEALAATMDGEAAALIMEIATHIDCIESALAHMRATLAKLGIDDDTVSDQRSLH